MIKLPDSWSDWILTDIIGEGAFATVYEAERKDDPSIRAAIKVIAIPKDKAETEELTLQGFDQEQTRQYFGETVDEFIREIKIMEYFKGTQNIVSIEDYKVEPKEDGIGSYVFIRMELLTPLDHYISDKTLTEQEVAQIGMDVCSALSLCASRNLIHRDIKPKNIFVNDKIGTNIFYKLGDFGIASTLEHRSSGLTANGTSNYIAPEVELGKPYDSRADIYSLGLTLYRLLNNNRLPFFPQTQLYSPSAKEEAKKRRMAGEKPDPPVNASPEMAAIILKACAYQPEDRYQNAEEMKKALDTLKERISTKHAKEKPPAFGIFKNKEKAEPKNKKTTQKINGLQASIILASILALCFGGQLYFRHRNSHSPTIVPNQTPLASSPLPPEETPNRTAEPSNTSTNANLSFSNEPDSNPVAINKKSIDEQTSVFSWIEEVPDWVFLNDNQRKSVLSVIRTMNDYPEGSIAYVPFSSKNLIGDIDQPNVPKIILDESSEAYYFTIVHDSSNWSVIPSYDIDNGEYTETVLDSPEFTLQKRKDGEPLRSLGLTKEDENNAVLYYYTIQNGKVSFLFGSMEIIWGTDEKRTDLGFIYTLSTGALEVSSIICTYYTETSDIEWQCSADYQEGWLREYQIEHQENIWLFDANNVCLNSQIVNLDGISIQALRLLRNAELEPILLPLPTDLPLPTEMVNQNSLEPNSMQGDDSATEPAAISYSPLAAYAAYHGFFDSLQLKLKSSDNQPVVFVPFLLGDIAAFPKLIPIPALHSTIRNNMEYISVEDHSAGWTLSFLTSSENVMNEYYMTYPEIAIPDRRSRHRDPALKLVDELSLEMDTDVFYVKFFYQQTSEGDYTCTISRFAPWGLWSPFVLFVYNNSEISTIQSCTLIGDEWMECLAYYSGGALTEYVLNYKNSSWTFDNNNTCKNNAAGNEEECPFDSFWLLRSPDQQPHKVKLPVHS